jgi:Rrf2 family transcriptional regulator, nitric oxide-sensitive transcriptional repressor
MRVTRYTDYSLRVLIYLGLRPHERSTIREISDAYAISRNHLMKVVQKLVARGYVESVRGVGGGLNLARPPLEIRVGEVVSDMEPDLALVECMRADNRCVITRSCKLQGMLARARASFLEVLNEYTLDDILQPQQARELALVLRIDSTMEVPQRASA